LAFHHQDGTIGHVLRPQGEKVVSQPVEDETLDLTIQGADQRSAGGWSFSSCLAR
jgi:hypothetical protein